MATVTFSSDLADNLRLKDLLSSDNGGFSFTNTSQGRTRASVVNGDETQVDYYAPTTDKFNDNFPIAWIVVGGFAQPSFKWDSSDAPLTVADLQAFHDGGSKSAATLMQGNDTITGADNRNYLEGYGGDDTIDAGSGDDHLVGGRGRDVLTGGDDEDAFIFLDVKDSTVKASGRDLIEDFSRSDEDRIDLRGIDANEDKAKDQAFSFIGSQDFHKKPGEVLIEKKSGDTWIYADTDGDGKADLAIQLEGAVNLKATDFLL